MRTSRFWYGLSLALATWACAETGSKLALSDITQPDFFPILPWSPYHGWSKPFVEHRPNGLASIAECHFNMDGSLSAFDQKNGLWLVAGQGALLALGK